MDLISQLAGYGATVAVVSDDVSLDYAGLSALVRTKARTLAAAGIGPGSVVGLEVGGEVDHLVATLALLAMGVRHVTLPTHDPETAKLPLIERAAVTHRLSDGGLETTGTALRGADDEGVVYLKTSGTTGGMNIVVFTLTQLRQQALRHPEYASERLLRLASIEHNNSKRHRLYCVLNGGTNVFRPECDIDLAAFCLMHGVTCLDISRMHASDLAARNQPERFSGIKLRTGGSAVPIDVRRAIEQCVTPQLYVRYASTESGAIAMALPGEHDEMESVGRPIAGVKLEIVDADDRPLPTGETGRIRMRAPGIATGYLDGGEQAASRFRDGWFWPGDMGMLRADGSLVVQGRQDDMMILNGINIFPGEIERVLERHPAVTVAAALPISSTVHGQIPVAAVELHAGQTVTAGELAAFAREHLALRAPRRILVLDALPRNSQGKVVRREIAPLFVPRRRQGS